MLANSYRPHTLNEVIGQDTVVKALRNAFKTNTLGNVIYLIGNSGTGKNTIANIIASTLVCEHPAIDDKGNINPCCKCPSCIDVIEEKNQKVETYAGANLTADALKELEDKLGYSTVFVKHRVIIVNEAQQSPVLRRLLEVIETPYKDTTFVLTSTDKAKFSNTGGKTNKDQETQALRSRGTFFNLKPISTKQISEYLFNLTLKYDTENKIPESFYDEGLMVIAENANGNLRLAVNDFSTILNAEVYTEKEIVELLGYTNTQEYLAILNSICTGKSEILNRLYELDDLYGFVQYSSKILTENQIRGILGKPFDEEYKEKAYQVFKASNNLKKVYNLFSEINKESTGLFNGAYTNFVMSMFVNYFDMNPVGVKKPVKIPKNLQ